MKIYFYLKNKMVLLSEINSHVRDKMISFNEEAHIYTINGDSSYMSVTTFVHSNFPKFDANKIIEKMMKSENWQRNKYFGQTKEEIMAKWEVNRDEAANSGTEMHKLIEDYYNKIIDEKDFPANMIVMEYFKDFLQDYKDENEYKPYRSEWRVFDEELKIAGSIDMVFENNKGELLIYDWKRCRNINKGNDQFKYGKPLNPDLNDMFDTNYWHYVLQLNIYKIILERNYNKKVTELALINLHPNNWNKSYCCFFLPILNENQINGIIKWRFDQLTTNKV